MFHSASIQELLADSQVAFLNQQYDKALELANQGLVLEPNNADAHKCAGDAYMLLKRFDEAVRSYGIAVKIEPGNGNRYYDLGYVLALKELLADALENFAKADELGCSTENHVQLYHMLGRICFEMRRYDEALINLNKARKLAGIDLDILQRIAVVYGIKGDIRRGLETANQIKLVASSEYMGYKAAFQLLIKANRLDEAERELGKAERFAAPVMDLYFDKITLELEKYKTDKDEAHLYASLNIIEEALKTVEPKIASTVDCYINAAELYLQLEHTDKALDCLHAAQSPVFAYNNGFAVADTAPFKAVSFSDADIEDMVYEAGRKIENELGEYGLEELAESMPSDEEGNHEYFTEIIENLQEGIEAYKLDESEPALISPDNVNQINRLYVGAYMQKKDFKEVIAYAKVLQASGSTQDSYLGKYAQAHALKELGSEDAEVKYKENIGFFRDVMIRDPSDIMAITFRVQCYIDIGEYDEAEEVCSLLMKGMRTPLLEKIAAARLGGGNNGIIT